ncbi:MULTISPECIES: sigma-70 family RNA polymerase sigma factor [Caproicibacterium]|uniref:Sigma-70 family RNA polymerase sigma factor n=1 Tax=Caproicibacterium argilliputei TaxID=3030016 RepID=A0AA97DDL1_9FIRM|nr:sigma-70 family RNA polymerase sigma factor [Caproicibacterium argilliputei]WOC33607.1 sigma-70 family RNA polymerase sigma factor [Caproicibacterium argilliputei]
MDKPLEHVLSACTDGQLAESVQNGIPDAFAELTARYLDLVRAKATPFHCTFLDADDLCQEGLWGLYLAACTYQPDKGARFSTYAGICIRNCVVAAYRKAVNGRQLPPNGFVPLSEGEELSAPEADEPEVLLLSKERLETVQEAVQKVLTPMEQRVLKLYLSGCKYSEVAQKIGISQKAADNALQRVRQKLRKQSS